MKTSADIKPTTTTHTLVLGPKRITYAITGDRAVVRDEITYVHPSTGARVTFCPDVYRMSTANARASWARQIAMGFKAVA